MSYNLNLDGIIHENVKSISALTEDGKYGVFRAVNEVSQGGSASFAWGFTERSDFEENGQHYVIKVSGIGFEPKGILLVLAPRLSWSYTGEEAFKNNANYGSAAGAMSSLLYYTKDDPDNVDPDKTIHQRIIAGGKEDGNAIVRVNPSSFTPVITGDSFQIKKYDQPYMPVSDVRYFWAAWAD